MLCTAWGSGDVPREDGSRVAQFGRAEKDRRMRDPEKRDERMARGEEVAARVESIMII